MQSPTSICIVFGCHDFTLCSAHETHFGKFNLYNLQINLMMVHECALIVCARNTLTNQNTFITAYGNNILHGFLISFSSELNLIMQPSLEVTLICIGCGCQDDSTSCWKCDKRLVSMLQAPNFC